MPLAGIDREYRHVERLLKLATKILYELDGKTLEMIRKELPEWAGPEIRDVAIKMDCLLDDLCEMED